MISKFSLAFFIGLISIVISGCAPSRYHLGFHQLAEEQQKQLYAPVSQKVDSLVATVKNQFIAGIAKNNFPSLIELFSPRLSKQLTDETIKDITHKMNVFEFNGQYEPLIVYDGPKFMLDEGVGKPPFDFYDYVGGVYKVSGKMDAIVDVYLTQVDSKVFVCGFRITPTNSPSGDIVPISFLAPESIDKARLSGRSYRTVR